MKEEFETAKAWVEKYEFCRFEGDLNNREESHPFIVLFLEFIKINVKDEKFSKRIFNILVDLFRTFQAYIPEIIKLNDYNGMIRVGFSNAECKIMIGSIGKSGVIEQIIHKVEEINPYVDNFEGQREFYKRILISNYQSSLRYFGFIDIMRKSNHKLLYNFEKIDEEHSYFSVIATVKAAI